MYKIGAPSRVVEVESSLKIGRRAHNAHQRLLTTYSEDRAMYVPPHRLIKNVFPQQLLTRYNKIMDIIINI